ncbi:P-loop containing nucleoside triphosphate hydrolase protein [Lipomyces chichibuensis]|uniref:P-loop containing nucleoside triphosphate hydrolase protein n=1 Tax=Lipomyces chichibuensis TaxID=1546026 RepID=UPI003343F92C
MVLCSDPEGWGPMSPVYYNFTPCFADSVVPLVLGIGLLVLIPRDLRALRKCTTVFSAPNAWFYVKFALLAIIVFCQLVYVIILGSISGSLSDLRIISTLFYIASLVAAGYVQYIEYFRARVPSGIVLFYWFMSVVTGFVKFYGQVQRKVWTEHETLFTSFVLGLFATIGELIVTACISRPPSQYESLSTEMDNSADAGANIFSRLTFFYLTKLMKLGYENVLTEEDLPDLPHDSRTDKTREDFDVAWQTEKQARVPSLPRALFRCFGSTYLIGIGFKLTGDVLAFMQPNLLRRLLLFVNSYNSETVDEPVPLSGGIIIVLGMFACSFAQTMMQQQYLARCFSTGLNIKSSLTSSIYRKSMCLSNESRQSKSTGDIVNYMTVDVQRLQDLAQSAQAIWSGPFQIMLCLFNLHALLGNSMWAGVCVTLCTILINAYIARKRRALQKVQMKVKDKRTRLTGEILASIKSIKLYAWEEAFITRLNAIRNDQELANLRKRGVYSAIANFVGSCAPFFVSCSTFAIFVWTAGRPLSTDIVFPALTLFNLLSNPLTQIPQVIAKFVEANISATRLRDFLVASELQPDAVKYFDAATQSGQSAVTIASGTFLWDEAGAHPALKNISFDAKLGQLACIVGRVGAGKSAFLQAILGDLYRESGSVTVRGHVAYCSQVPWIMNATVKENILFGKRFHAGFYEQTVHACALVEDFGVLPDGDETLVGEKGISLSGGQKARLALARAVYARADVYILDDPLSAVDQHVGRHLIDNVLGPQGLLATKTKIMATNAIAVLAQADSITMLRNGGIVETGLYSEIMTRTDSEIYKLVNEFGTHREQEEVLEETDEKTDPLASGKDEDEDEDEDLAAFHAGKFGVPLRRASTASFKKPTLIDDLPNRRSKQVKEHSEKGQVKLGVYREYIKAANVSVVVTFLVLMIASNSMSVGGNIWLKHWSDVNTRYGDNPDTGKYLGVYLFFGVTAAFLTLFYTLVLWIFCTIEAARKLHDRMLRHVIRSPMSFFDTTPLGRIINRFTADVNRVDEALARVFSNFLTNTCKVLFSIFVISLANPVFIVLVVPIAFLYVYYQKFYLRTSRALKRLESISRSPIYAHFQESLNGVSTVRAYSQIRRFNHINEYHIDFNNRAYYPSMIARRWLAIRLEFLGSTIIFSTALLSILAITSGRLSSGLVGLTMSYAFQVTQALGAIVRTTVEVEISTVSVERILEYCKLPCEAPEVIEDNRPRADWPTNGAVELYDYSTRYRPGLDLVLKGINLKIKPREKIGIVGRTGAGKSSLTLSLFRMIEPVGGFISIDSVNTSKLGLRDLRQRLAIIPQDSQAFEGSVRENLDPGSRFSDDQLWHVLELSHLKNHVASMDGGLYARIIEGGSNFSVGQRQLMSLARALLTPSKILVLDEATAAVDVETDQIIQETIRKEFKDRTILTIAHRLNTIIDSDRIVVLAAGKVVEFDTPQVLLSNKSSMFYALCKQGGLIE